MKIAIKFCGGCNPRHDRKICARKLIEKVASGEEVVYAQPGESYDRLYVICGCHTCCADIRDMKAEEIIYIDHMGQKDRQTSRLIAEGRKRL